MKQHKWRGVLMMAMCLAAAVGGVSACSGEDPEIVRRQNTSSGTGFANGSNSATVERPSGGTNVGGGENITGSATNTICTQALARVTDTCGAASTDFRFRDSCDVYDACEATCYNSAPCDALTADPATNASAKALDTCLTACYAEGTHTCHQAESKVHCCGFDVVPTWNHDGFCDAEERCVANCVVGAEECSQLLASNKTTTGKLYWDCADRCAEASLRLRPLTFDTAYCTQYPNDVHCGSDAAPTPAPSNLDRYCLVYPEATVCATPQQYCTDHPNDSWCSSSEYACALNQFSTSCMFDAAYCSRVTHGETDERCSYPASARCDTVPINGCAGVCAQVASAFGASYLMCALCICQDPAFASLCFGGSSPNGDDFCEDNPSAPECGICANYPRSRECSEGNYDEYNQDYDP